MRFRHLGAAGDRAVIGKLQVLLLERADVAAGLVRRRRAWPSAVMLLMIVLPTPTRLASEAAPQSQAEPIRQWRQANCSRQRTRPFRSMEWSTSCGLRCAYEARRSRFQESQRIISGNRRENLP
ncbi:hypothetical protein [Bradyrhizobium sp. 27S5]|uniref:hypothetical protein n=1 Tax=Bradyrhizobium sp. 27S5 TaxID=3139728 RepID=UPI0030CCEED3